MEPKSIYSTQTKRHAVLIPFMSKGHTFPLLHLAHLLLSRQVAVTFFTTAANRPFIARSLADTSAAIASLPFPENIPGIPAGVESTEALPSMSLFFPMLKATELMKPHFDQAIKNLLPHVSFIVSDGFLWWTHHSAAELGVPRFVSYGMSSYAMAISRDVAVTRVLASPDIGDDDLVPVSSFPWVKVTKRDFEITFNNPKLAHPVGAEIMKEVQEATAKSFGLIFNSFFEMEEAFADYWDRECGPKSYCVGPLSLAYQVHCAPKTKGKQGDKDLIQKRLDEKLEKGSSVLYVAFGSQAEISPQQMKELAKGLEESEVDFVWVVRKKDRADQLLEEFENRVGNRGIVVREWVEQREILSHQSVKGFLSHCGWNSVLESISAAVPILAWPIMAEQPINARMVADDMKVGLTVEKNCDGFVEWEEVKEKVKELMEGEKGKEVRKKVKEVADMAKKAVEEGGSSWKALEKLISET